MNNNNWQLEIIETLDQIESIRSVWQQLQAQEPCPVINADIDRYLSVLKANENQPSPLILLLKKGQSPRAMIIGRREKLSILVRIGYKTFFRPKLNAMTVVYGGVLGQPDNETSALLCKEIRKLLRKRQIDVVFFNHLRIDTPFYTQIRRVSFWYRSHFPVIEPHWRMAIPQTIEDFYVSKSKNFRKHIKKYFKRLEIEYPEQLKLKTFKLQEQLENAIQAAAQISRNTYQSSLGVGFEDNVRNRSLIKVASQKGWFRAHILYMNKDPIAFRFALKYGKVYYGDGIGYVPEWKDYNIGTISLVKVLEILCTEKIVDYYDFGFGDAFWKQSVADESWPEAAATYLFAPRAYPLAINCITLINSALTLGLLWAVKKCGFYSWIKRKWRNSLMNNFDNK